MLYPTGSFIALSTGSLGNSEQEPSVVSVCANKERTLFAVVRVHQIHLYLAEPEVELCNLVRADDCVKEKGQCSHLAWKPDSTFITVATSRNFLLFYRIELDGRLQSYQQNEHRNTEFHRTSLELFPKGAIPAVQIVPAFAVHLPSRATKLVPLRDELVVALADGRLWRLLWNGATVDELNASLQKIAFAHDQQQSKAEYVSGGVFISDIAYSPLIGGFAFSLSDGRSGLLTSANLRFSPTHVHGVWAPTILSASCCSVNHKYRILVFGERNGDASSFAVDEATGALALTHRYQLSAKDCSDVAEQLGAVRCLVWSPLYETLAIAWELGGVAMFTVFGSLLWCSLPDSTSSLNNGFDRLLRIISMDFGPEGFRLWLGCDRSSNCDAASDVYTLRLLRVVNPDFTACANSLVLLGDNSVRIALSDRVNSLSKPMASQYWDVHQVPASYVGGCWPLRFCAVDCSSRTLCVAGSRGLAHCNLSSRKWRLFGNESQEKEFVVSGGLCWWQDFLAAACFSTSKSLDEIRFYPRSYKLDSAYCTAFAVTSQILQLALRDDVMLTFDVDGHVNLFKLTAVITPNSFPRVSAVKVAEIVISELIPHFMCVSNVQLASLGHESSDRKFCNDFDTLLVNIAGRLVMLSPDKRTPPVGPASNQLHQPMLVASFVENVWCSATGDGSILEKPHLSKALWIHCGSRGMRVWMPLFPKQSGGNHTFISKRIMLPFEIAIYPLGISSAPCLVHSIETVVDSHLIAQTGNATLSFTLKRSSEVYLHHILKQLLRRNLGLYALEIARTCLDLPYFSHVLELLLHTVLEEEATSSEPIPDPLLPRIVAFIQEFPEFLQTVAHCARKTEMALWNHLFAAVGNPSDLFEVCLRDGKLQTAASFLIVLQNMESVAESKDHVTRLLEATLASRQLSLAKEIVRFLKSIDPSDIDTPPRTPMFSKQARQQVAANLVSPAAADEAESFLYQSTGRQRITSLSANTVSPLASPTERDASPNQHKLIGKATSDPKRVDAQPTRSSGYQALLDIVQNHFDALERYEQQRHASISASRKTSAVASMETTQRVPPLRLPSTSDAVTKCQQPLTVAVNGLQTSEQDAVRSTAVVLAAPSEEPNGSLLNGNGKDGGDGVSLSSVSTVECQSQSSRVSSGGDEESATPPSERRRQFERNLKAVPLDYFPPETQGVFHATAHWMNGVGGDELVNPVAPQDANQCAIM